MDMKLFTIGRPVCTLLVAMTVLVTACSKKMNFGTSSIVPTARGDVKVKRDDNRNYEVSINVLHLAEPERLPTPKKAYVVWMETDQNGVQNVGQLRPDESLLTKTIKASMKTTSVYPPKRVFITAEDEATVTTPGSMVVLNTSSF